VKISRFCTDRIAIKTGKQLIGTTVCDVLDRYVEMFGWHATLLVVGMNSTILMWVLWH